MLRSALAFRAARAGGTREPGRPAPRRRAAAWVALVVLGTAGCVSKPSRRVPLEPAEPAAEQAGPRTYGAPRWRRMPNGWERLEAIETWLAGPGRIAPARERLDAELELAEGRLAFAQSDRDTLSDERLRQRLEAAEAGFHRIAGDDDATPLQRYRARSGLARVANWEPGGASPQVALYPRTAWHAARPIPSRLTTARAGWDRITIHHSAEPARHLRSAGFSSAADTVLGIQRYHMRDASTGYGDIGYHFLIDPAGRLFAGRSLEYQGAHAGGANNRRNIGICLLGDFERETPSSAALRTLVELVDDLRERHAIARTAVVGHGELKVTACPGRTLKGWLERYRRGGGRAPLTTAAAALR